MSQKSSRRRWGAFNQRRLRVETLEGRAMLAGIEPSVFVFLDNTLPLGQPREGGNESTTDHIVDWRMVAELSDVDGGDFLLEMSFGNAIFGEPGDVSYTKIGLPPEDSENPDSLFRWKVAFDWDTLPVAFLDTHPGNVDRQVFVRATELDSIEAFVSTNDTTVTLFNSMPFFGTVSATPSGGGGCGGSSGVTVAGTFTEYGINDAVTLRVHWGDGNTDIVHNAALMSNQQNVPFSVDHTYAAAGSYNITWEIFDDEGGATSLPSNPASTGGVTGFNVSGGGGGSSSVCLNGNVLTVIGSAGNDTVTISQPTGLVRVESSFFPTTDFPAASVESVLVQLGAGDDTLLDFTSLPTVVVGGDGNDILTGGSGRNILIGGLGSDLIYGGAGEDILVDGETTHDGNAVALLAMLAEWNSAHSFIDRVRNLINGSGSVQGLNETPEGSFFLVPAGNDLALDLLLGGSGTDWFVRNGGEFSFG
jgi:Ca2+-binding RTX toxin-like protein